MPERGPAYAQVCSDGGQGCGRGGKEAGPRTPPGGVQGEGRKGAEGRGAGNPWAERDDELERSDEEIWKGLLLRARTFVGRRNELARPGRQLCGWVLLREGGLKNLI